jgi:chemotaxis protein methyltransferase CheR
MVHRPTGDLGLSTSAAFLLRDLIHEQAGVYYADDRCDLLVDRLAPLVIERGFDDAAGEWGRVMDALAVNETYFWREVDQLRAVVDVLLPQLAEATDGPLRIWSIPCASGEEPLTLAMLLSEAGWFARADIEIVGSDASPSAVASARRGWYRERSFRSLPLALRNKYFTREGEGWRVDERLHSRVQWSVANLMVPGDWDSFAAAPIVLCRNVFIYFSDGNVRRTVRAFAERMPFPSYLCVGASESLLKHTTHFTLEEVAGAFVYAKTQPVPVLIR